MLPQSVGLVSAPGLLCSHGRPAMPNSSAWALFGSTSGLCLVGTAAGRGSMSGHHVFARRRGVPSLSYRLGQISCGATPIASASRRSIAGQGCFSAFPAAVG